MLALGFAKLNLVTVELQYTVSATVYSILFFNKARFFFTPDVQYFQQVDRKKLILSKKTSKIYLLPVELD